MVVSPGYLELEAAIFKFIDAVADGALAAGLPEQAYFDKTVEAVNTAFVVAMGKYQRGLDRSH